MDASIITKVDARSKNVITLVAATEGRKKKTAMSEIQTMNSMEGEEDNITRMPNLRTHQLCPIPQRDKQTSNK